MRKIVMFLVVLFIAVPLGKVFADGCYTCKGGGYVKYVGDETFAKRKEAKEKFQCEVTGTSGSCSNPKGTVEDKK